MGGQAGRQTGRQTDRQTDRQTVEVGSLNRVLAVAGDAQVVLKPSVKSRFAVHRHRKKEEKKPFSLYHSVICSYLFLRNLALCPDDYCPFSSLQWRSG
jgi:hypothetical protein